MIDKENAVKSPIEIRLHATPKKLTMADRDRFCVGLTAINKTDTALDPHLYAVRLLVNETPSAAFDLAVGNGVMPTKWDVLPAGETTPPVVWPLGTSLFTKPGEYMLVLRFEWGDWAPVESSAMVTVTP